MKQARNVTFWTIDLIVYSCLFMIGISFIVRDDVFRKLALKRTNFARHQEPILERPTILVYIEPPSITLVYGEDFNISYGQQHQTDNVNLTIGENNVGKNVTIEFEEVFVGNIFKLTPIISHDALDNYNHIITFIPDNSKLETASDIFIGFKLSTESNSVHTYLTELLDGKPTFYKIGLGTTMLASLTPKKTVRLPGNCRTIPSNELYLRQLSDELSSPKCSGNCQLFNWGKRLNKLIDKVPICELDKNHTPKTGQNLTCFSQFNSEFSNTMRRIQRPCTTIEYKGITQRVRTPERQLARFFYRFTFPTEVEVHEEYRIHGVEGVISSIGGTLGIFIGVSVYDFLKFCLSHLANIIQKNM